MTYNAKHGLSRHPGYRATYLSWLAMRQRANYPKRRGYERHGGRGILVCDRWDSFPAFLADMGVRPAGATIERENNDRGYEPDNCRWATAQDQARNRSNNVHVTINGERMLVVEAVEKFGTVSYGTAMKRIEVGWEPSQAVLTPARNYTRK